MKFSLGSVAAAISQLTPQVKVCIRFRPKSRGARCPRLQPSAHMKAVLMKDAFALAASNQGTLPSARSAAKAPKEERSCRTLVNWSSSISKLILLRKSTQSITSFGTHGLAILEVPHVTRSVLYGMRILGSGALRCIMLHCKGQCHQAAPPCLEQPQATTRPSSRTGRLGGSAIAEI